MAQRHIATFESFDGRLMMLWSTYMELVNGIDGIISEFGELPTRYWKEITANELNRITDVVKDISDVNEERKNIKKNLEELLDGISGWTSEKGPPNRYFKPGVIEKARVEATKTVL